MLERLAVARNRPDRLITGDEARRLVADGAMLIDVRSPREFANGHLPGAVNVPIDEFERHVDELLAERPRDGPLLRRRRALQQGGGDCCARPARTGVHQLGTLARWSEPA